MSGPNLAAALTRAQARQAAHMPDSCQIVETATSTDETGGEDAGYEDVLATVPCRIATGAFRDVENVRNEQVRGVTDWVITMPLGTPVRADHVVRSGGREFAVRSVDDLSSYGTAVRAFATLVR